MASLKSRFVDRRKSKSSFSVVNSRKSIDLMPYEIRRSKRASSALWNVRLLKFNTENSDDQDNGNTKEILQFIKKLLEPYSKIQFYETNKGNLIALLPNPKKLPLIGLQGHLDTVPIEKTRIEQKNGKIYGRGSVDMKGNIAVMINEGAIIAGSIR